MALKQPIHRSQSFLNSIIPTVTIVLFISLCFQSCRNRTDENVSSNKNVNNFKSSERTDYQRYLEDNLNMRSDSIDLIVEIENYFDSIKAVNNLKPKTPRYNQTRKEYEAKLSIFFNDNELFHSYKNLKTEYYKNQ